MSKTITIIDTFGFFFRSFYALPPLSNKDGFPTGLLTGFTNFISTLQKDHDSDYILFALDSKGNTFRNEVDPNYKANRSSPPEELSMQLPIAIDWIEKMGFQTLAKVGFEADDIIATVTHLARQKGINVRVVSHDKDLYQLIRDNEVVIVDAIKRKSIDEEICYEKYGVTPAQFIDYQSILGDSADNVPGVKGIGKVGAEKLLKQYGSLDNVYENINAIKPPGVQKKLIESKENAYMSKTLVTLREDVFESVDFESFKMHDENPFVPIYDEMEKYEMNGVLRLLKAKGLVNDSGKKVNSSKNESSEVVEEVERENNLKFEAILLNNESALNEVLSALSPETIIAFDTETTGLSWQDDTLVGFSFALNDETAYYVPMAHNYLGVEEQISNETAKAALLKIFESKVVGHNIKFDLHFVLKYLHISALPIHADSMILAWLVNPQSALSLDKLSAFLLNHEMIAFKDTIKKGETFAGVNLEDACNYAAEDALITFKLYHLLLGRLNLQNLRDLETTINSMEIPFISTLLGMEKAGIKVDTGALESFKDEVEGKLDILRTDIYAHAGSEFNINSTKQLGVILFETLGLRVIKKTKTGYSTDEKVLNALKDEHPIMEDLLSYRELFKLYSTYILPLLELAGQSQDSRVHTSFVQTGTATGRLSSKNPNLQNIPVKSELGNRVRAAFVAPEGKTLIGIDYSQIELRLLAHFSQDAVLLDAFNSDKDIHMQTAIALFGEEDAASKRNTAKTVNFGLLYGMGQKKLAETLGITTKEAKDIISKYFESFPTVKQYFSSIVENSKEDGYIETLLGRRRYFDYDNATPMFKAAYERESVNSVFQGSAADLIKLSMNKIHRLILDEQLNAKMLLQIHDELIFEVDTEESDALAEKFRSVMESIYGLNVPLKVSVNIGHTWAELK